MYGAKDYIVLLYCLCMERNIKKYKVIDLKVNLTINLNLNLSGQRQHIITGTGE